MSITAPPVALAHVTLAEWDEDYSQRDDAYELVEGVPTVAPNEHFDNVDATMLLAEKLGPIIRPEWRPLAPSLYSWASATGDTPCGSPTSQSRDAPGPSRIGPTRLMSPSSSSSSHLAPLRPTP